MLISPLFFSLAAGLVFAADESPAVTQARQELVRLRDDVSAGLVPASKLIQAQEAIDDALDEDTLDRTLYGHIEIEDLTESQASEMVAATERRVDRVQVKVDRGKELVAQGIAAPGMFEDVATELTRRRETLDQAKARAALLRELAEVAQAEAKPAENVETGIWKAKEYVDGDHLLESRDVRDITLAYEGKFHEPFPVSARGATAVHRAMGFDHTGRIDVAVTPDSVEGVWLRAYLEAKAIPYYAFRVAIPGKATAPHIHIGPGSLRIHPTD